ncbi:uncharacterized protein METZ01_LOCUS324818, partial [marine metagenome]
MLVKREVGTTQNHLRKADIQAHGFLDRRSFLKNSGLAACGTAALASTIPLARVRKARAAANNAAAGE